jgi:N-methylhydantoinase B/oxoprolinase/acetone carboxylase alpha subunit
LADSQVTLICERRKFQPYGLAGGQPGASGADSIIDPEGNVRFLGSKSSVQLRKGHRVRIETPGGGGWGEPSKPPSITG